MKIAADVVALIADDVAAVITADVAAESEKNDQIVWLLKICNSFMSVVPNTWGHDQSGNLIMKVKNVKCSIARSPPVENLLPQNVGSINYLQLLLK